MKRIIFSEKSLNYSYHGHIESPERVRIARDILLDKGYEFIEPELASESDLTRAHDIAWIRKVEKGGYFDGDTPGCNEIGEYARLSAGGAILAAKEQAFSLMRPPGHHAGINGRALGAPTLGFCYINNIAVAVRYLDKPTLILDIDGHHGNGTEEIFKGDSKVFFISLHRGGIYPGTGYESDQNCLNFPFYTIPGDDVYLSTFNKALSKVDLDRIDVVAISAGFDCHGGDLATLGLTPNAFKEIGKKISLMNKYTFGVLEGGYIGENLGEDMDKLISELS